MPPLIMNDKIRDLIIHSSRKCFIDSFPVTGRTLLHSMCTTTHLSFVQMLLNDFGHEFEVNVRDSKGRTPLHDACFFGRNKVAEWLIFTARADVNASDNLGRTALHYACRNGQGEITRLLTLRARADTNVKDIDGWVPLDFARERGNEVIEELLVENASHGDVLDKAEGIDETPILVNCKYFLRSMKRQVCPKELEQRIDLCPSEDTIEVPPHVIPKPFSQNQEDITIVMRRIVVDWIFEVQKKYKILSSTLWLGIQIQDRYLEHEQVYSDKLQLVGIVALRIACSAESGPWDNPLQEAICCTVCDNAFTVDEVIETEQHILQQLEFHIRFPTGYNLLERFLDSLNASEKLRNLAFYCAERNLQEYDVCLLPPSQFAAAALLAAMVNRAVEVNLSINDCWTIQHVEITGYSINELQPHVINVLKHVSEEHVTKKGGRVLVNVKKKYASPKYGGVSKLISSETVVAAIFLISGISS